MRSFYILAFVAGFAAVMVPSSDGGASGPSSPPLTLTGAAPIVVTPSGSGDVPRALSLTIASPLSLVGGALTCPSCQTSAGGSPFPISPSGTVQPGAALSVTGSNSGVYLIPNNNGPVAMAVPDGTATGGNARGENAVDLQIFRERADLVASGNQSFAAGASNKVSGIHAGAWGYGNAVYCENCSTGGATNNLTATGATAFGQSNDVQGQYAGAIGYNNHVHGGHSFAVGSQGNDRGNIGSFVQSQSGERAQAITYVFQGYLADAIPRVLVADTAINPANLGALAQNSGNTFRIDLVINVRGSAACSYSMGPGVVYRDNGAAVMGSANPPFVAGPVVGPGASDCTLLTLPTVTTDSNNGYTITVTPNPGNSALLVMTARVHVVEAF